MANVGVREGLVVGGRTDGEKGGVEGRGRGSGATSILSTSGSGDRGTGPWWRMSVGKRMDELVEDEDVG